MIKKILLVAGLAVAGGLWFLWFVGGQALEKEAAGEELTAAQRIEQPDSDQDGLADWEEGLWGADPKNPDADGDGTPDGEEVKLGRDPRRAGPNDRLTNDNDKNVALVHRVNRQSGPPLSKISTQDLPDFRQKLSDLQLKEIADKKVIKNYGRELAAAFKNYSVPGRENEMRLILQILDDQTPAGIQKISRLREGRQTVARQLTALSVPQSAGPAHLNLVNALWGLAELDFYMEQVPREPIIALEAAMAYPERYGNFLTTVAEINKYFAKQKIRFDENDRALIVIN